MQKQKIIAGIICLVTLLTQSFGNWVFFSWSEVEASWPVEEDKLVAMFVEQNIYDALKADIQWYTIQYIQWRFERTKVLVFPVDTNKIQATDIQKILSNLYHWGEKDTPSTLIGTILLWNIPLPVVKKDTYIFPSILPYTDIEKPLYVFDQNTNYFTPSTSTPDNRQELIHGLIRFNTPAEYSTYFSKLKAYARDPKSFAEKKFWFEDFNKAEQTFTDQNVPLYIQWQIFDEDLAYHRYSPTLFWFMQQNNNNDALQVFKDVWVTTNTPASEDYPDESSSVTKPYTDSLTAWGNNLSNAATQWSQSLQQIGWWDQIPTLVMGQSILQQIKLYESIFSAEYGDYIAEQIETSARWTGTDIWNHITKASVVDQQTSRAMFGLNTILENTLDAKIKNENWSVNIPIPVVREEYKCVLNIPTTLDMKQENFYFGKNAWDITWAIDTSWFRGTYGNYTSPTQALWLWRWGVLYDSTDSTLRWVWASFGFTNQQIVASRWYNSMNAKKDADAYEYRRKHCGTNNNANIAFDTYIRQYRWGNTPTNIDWNTMLLKSNDWEQAFNPSYNRGIWWPLFDIAGSKLTQSLNVSWYNAVWANTYWRMLQVAPWRTGLWGILFWSANFPWCEPKTPVPSSQYDYFAVMTNTSNKDIQVVAPTATSYNDSKTCKERLVYKTIDSTVKHTSPTKEEVQAMNITTRDRPIDVKRYISFKWLGWQIIDIQYPDLYNVEIYKNDGNALVLKSVDEIKQSIVSYLETKVQEYNTILGAQNSMMTWYVAGNQAALTKLAATDSKASPVWRQYNVIPNDFFTSVIWAETISQLAQDLYLKNSGWPIRLPSNTVSGAIQWLESQFSLSSKIYATVENNIVVWQKWIWVNTTWYEAWYIRANWSNTITAKTTPSLIENADNKRQTTKAATNELTTNSDKQEATIDDACGVGWDGTVPLLKWPKALTCRWKNLRKVSLKDAVKISYKNAQWPVLPLKQFADTVTSTYEDYANKVLEWDYTQDSIVTSLSLQLPGQKVIRWAQLPFNALAKNSKGEEISNLIFPVEIAADTGDLLTIGQSIPKFETTTPSETTILDTTTISPNVSRVHISIRWPLESNADTWLMLHDEKEIILVEGTLQVLVNNQPSTDLRVLLPDNWYNTVTAWIPSVNENILPSIALRLTDWNSQPITSPVTITSSKWLVKPWVVTTTKEQTPIGQVDHVQFTTQNLWTIQGGVLNVKLLPSMVAWTDTLTISIPWLPDRIINVSVWASNPYAVSVIDDTQNNWVRLAVQDRWGNTIQNSQSVQYSIIWDATSNWQTQWNVPVSWSTILPINYWVRWWTVYIYWSLWSWANSQPWYIRKDIPTRLRPTTGLNIVYLTLEWNDRGNINDNLASSIISTSPKTISVTTELFSQSNNLPVVWIIWTDWMVSQDDWLSITTGSAGRKNIVVDNITVWYIEWNAPYTLSKIVLQNATYKVIPSWIGWSTNNQAFAIVEARGETPDTKDPDLSPIRSYAGWVTVWEAQKQIFDDTRINYGDPFLQHIDAQKIVDSSKDTTITLFKDDTKTIKKTMELDIDSDGRKDLVILYDDDTIRFMKQYGWTPPYRQLGNLMAVADWVQDMWIWDADNNWLQDIFIRTKKNTLRVYKNNAWTFDVNGSPICIDVPSGNTSLQDVWQLFIEDMNKDKQADIITYDVSGKIRIFYGGNKWWDGYYISTNAAGCDAGRKQRNSSLTVATYGLQLVQNTPIYDDSIIHWQWLSLPSDTSDENNDTIPASIAGSIPDPSNPTSINIQWLINAGIPDVVRYSPTPYDHLPVYENTTSWEQIAYIPLKYLTWADIVDVSKTFAYWQWDEVIVNVTMRAKQNTIATYAEQLRWPWEINKNDDGSISWFNNMNLPSSSIIDWNIDNGFEFMIDNIPLAAWQSVSFSYPVRYRPAQSTTIWVSDTNNDWWLDITTTPVDSCMPTSLTYISNQWVTYTSTNQTVNTSYSSWINQLQWDLNSQLQNTNTASQNIANGTWSLWQIPWMEQAFESWQDFVKDWVDVTSLSSNTNFDLNVLSDPKIEKTIDDVVKWLCKWSSAWGWKWLPVPFNMAFLCPGDFNVFWMKAGSDKWLPVFFFPGTLQTPAWPIPMPYWLKWPGDGFYWAAWWVYPSMIRIYVSPTLTMWVWVAVCFGPYAAWINLPSPIKHIAWNCIVIAKKWLKASKRPTQTPGHPESDTTTNLGGGWNSSRTCSNPTQSVTRPTSPFTMSAYDWSRDLPTRPTPVENTQSPWITQWTYLWIINFDTQPYATQLSQQKAWNVQLKWGKAIKLQIQWWNVKWLIKCIINKWLDNQIRYMINNLTNMSINVYLPDVSQLMQWFKNVRLDEINKVADNFKQQPWSSNTPAGSILKNLVTKAEWEKSATSQSDVSELGWIINNPFNALSSWFEQVPLIKVNTKNVTVQVPYIYSEDLTKYTAQAESYSKQIEKDLRQWEYLIQDLTWKCDKEQTPNRKEACNKQLASYIDISTKTQQLQRSIKQNISTLQAYKRFPLELQQWLTVSQRYITEVTDTVQWISTDITAWLNTNATRFSKYVDAIILMVSAVKSWQALIDFSVNWKSKCWQCTVDNYDYYSCTLWMLCPKLPILAIPPFRLPNIYVDLSHIKLWMDVVLPNIHFVPKTLTLPVLPEIPSPPTVNIDFTVSAEWITGLPKVPTIPQIPSPPKLPELPSFIPSIDINLPTLPPAPKVPRLSPAITSTLKVTSVIWKILCIVKNGIWLVWEKWVKTRIEQLTQRTRSVAPFDSLSITTIQPPLRWFDLRVDSYLNFEMNFDVLYNMLDKLTKWINQKSSNILNWVTAQSNAISQWLNEGTQWAQWVIDQWNVNAQGTISAITEPELVEPSVLRSDLQREIAALKNSEYGPLYTNEVTTIENLLTTKSNITPNIASVQKATKSLEWLLKRTSDTLEDHKNSINTYDSFLKQINSDFLIGETNDIQWDISASLFTANDSVIHTLKTAEHPTTSYLNLQEKIVRGFENALTTKSPDDLNMWIFEYNRLRKYFWETDQKIQDIKWYITSETPHASETSIATKTLDTVQTIIAPTVEAATVNIPLTPSNTQDIWWDDHNIYTNQTTYIQKENDWTRFTRYYDFDPITKYSDFASRVDEQWYIARYNSAFSVWNWYTPITSLEVAWQSNTATNIHRKNWAQKAYAIMLSDTIYANHELNYSRNVERKYVIAYDSWFDIQNSFVTLPNIWTKRVSDLLWSTIINTIPFDATEDDIDIMLSLTWNKWSYASIAPLVVNTRWSIWEMTVWAAWSVQETLWVQRRGDNTAPVANARVVDKRTWITVATWTNVSVPRNGQYDVVVQWTDDWVVIENEIVNKDNTSKVYNWDSATIENIKTTETYNILATAKDQSLNQWTQTITIKFQDPKIEINAVAQQWDEREIWTSLSQAYPNWFVRFYNQRSSDPYLLTWKEQWQLRSDFNTNTTTSLTWRVFFDTDTISLFNWNQERIARIEKKTWKIIVSQDRQSRIRTSLDFTQNTPSVLIIDTKTQTTLFSLYLKSASLLAIDEQNWFTKKQLTDVVWTFAWWTCIEDQNQVCVVYVTTDWNIYSADPQKWRVGWTYIYDWWLRYSITIDGKVAWLVSFTPIPLE